MSANREKKGVIIAEVTEKVQKAKGMVFTNFQGLTHHQLETLKKAAKSTDAEYVATKNTLLLRTLAEKNLADTEKAKFQNPTATLFIYNDIVAPLKHLAKSIKDLKLPEIKFGLIDGKIMTSDEILKLSTLPPIEVLRAQLLGQMMSPIQSLHRALRWNLQGLVITLNAIAKKKQ